MNVTLRARTLPYRPELKADQRCCTRCGILFTINTRRIVQHDECKDCR